MRLQDRMTIAKADSLASAAVGHTPRHKARRELRTWLADNDIEVAQLLRRLETMYEQERRR